MKFAGSLIILGTVAYYGTLINRTMDNRYLQLRHLYTILLQLKSEMLYMNETLPDCFSRLGETAKEPLKKWLLALSEDLKNQEETSFFKIWKKNLKLLGNSCALTKEDILLLEELGDKLGNPDGQSQIKAIDYVLLQLEHNRNSLQGEMKDKKKVVMTITMFVGFVTLIVLL